MSRLFKASIIENKQLIKNHYLLTLHPLEKIKKPKPGQFFMVSTDNGLDPLLKRPFSIHRLIDGDFQLLYRVVGKGTEILSHKKHGDTLEVIGPLGNEFPVKKSQKNIILIAGGLGIAPIFALAEAICKQFKVKKDNPPQSPFCKGGITYPLLFYGTRTKEQVLCIDELKTIGIDPIISTDDGSRGKKGNIINVFNNFLSRHALPVTRYVLFACGPKEMLKSLSILSKKFKLEGYITLEENMACGFGTCLGCVVNTNNGFKRVCKEGPVFSIEEIVWYKN